MKAEQDVKSMTDEELDAALEKKYGKDWAPSEVDKDDELFKEFIERISCGETPADEQC